MVKLDKNQLIDLCVEKLQQRINGAKESMIWAQESANSEDKSSAGDKYETSRAMGQLDRDMYAKQLSGANQDLKFFRKIDFETRTDAAIGSLVITTQKNYFMAVGVGVLKVRGIEVITLSANAPLCKLLLRKKAGDEIQFMKNSFRITEII